MHFFYFFLFFFFQYMKLYFFLISSMLAKLQEDQRLIAMSSIKYLNFKFFCSLKLYIKINFMDLIVNNIRLA